MKTRAKRIRPTITLKLTGVESEGGLIRLDDFIRGLNSLEEALACLDRESHGESTLYYRIVKMSQNSPAKVMIEPVLKPHLKGKRIGNRYGHYPKQIQRRFFDTFDSINQNRADAPTPGEPVIDAIAKLLEGLGSDFTSGEIADGKTRVKLDEAFKEKVTNLVVPHHKSYGSVEGELLALNVAKGRRQFGIYPKVGPRSVVCSFPEDLFDEACRNIRKNVRVYGTKLFSHDTGFPFKITDVTRIEVLKFPDGIPPFVPTKNVPAVDPEQLVKESREE
jgi:hypothetical protein